MCVDKEITDAVRFMDARTSDYTTDEQIEFMSDFTKPVLCFANPGTGKTYSIVRGLILAQTYHGIAGRHINAMSFTKEATAELAHRYDEVCRKCNLQPTVQFNTFHKISRQIVNEKFPEMKITNGDMTLGDLNTFAEYMEGCGIEAEDMYYVRKVYETINKLNHSMIFDDENVVLSYAFKQLDLSLEDYKALRKNMFVKGIVQDSITQGDIPMYAMYVLCKYPEIRDKYRRLYKIMVVDEFQDMTKMYLTVLSMICDNLVVVGDIKQQIYGFNGASSDIVDVYHRLYPDARSVELRQSYRCFTDIAEFATSVVRPNYNGIEAFKGIQDGGEVRVESSQSLDIHKVVEDASSEMKEGRTTMFLFRNNFAITPIAEELYQQRVPFRVKKFRRVMDFPIYKELSELAFMAEDPEDIECINNCMKYFPQFKQYYQRHQENPLIRLLRDMEKKGDKRSVYSVPYAYDDMTKKLLNQIFVAGRQIGKVTCDRIFEMLMPIYEEFIICKKWWLLKDPPEYYEGLVRPIITRKSFSKMVADEMAKSSFVTEATNLGRGIRCYTMHSAKGLEADNVYILDADAGVFPNEAKLTAVVDAGCLYEAGKMVREERNLLYVGATRAKSKLVITHTGPVTELIARPNMNRYSVLDDAYYSCLNNCQAFDDVGAFRKMTNISGNDEMSMHAETDINGRNYDLCAV